MTPTGAYLYALTQWANNGKTGLRPERPQTLPIGPSKAQQDHEADYNTHLYNNEWSLDHD